MNRLWKHSEKRMKRWKSAFSPDIKLVSQAFQGKKKDTVGHIVLSSSHCLNPQPSDEWTESESRGQ